MYKKMYHILFRAAADAMELIEGQEYQRALSVLEEACRNAEETYLSEG